MTDAAPPLIRVDKETQELKLNDKDLLANDDPNRACAALAIIGPTRHGKSFLMNWLLGQPGQFKVNDGQPVTEGIDVSGSNTLTLSSLQERCR